MDETELVAQQRLPRAGLLRPTQAPGYQTPRQPAVAARWPAAKDVVVHRIGTFSRQRYRLPPWLQLLPPRQQFLHRRALGPLQFGHRPIGRREDVRAVALLHSGPLAPLVLLQTERFPRHSQIVRRMPRPQSGLVQPQFPQSRPPELPHRLHHPLAPILPLHHQPVEEFVQRSIGPRAVDGPHPVPVGPPGEDRRHDGPQASPTIAQQVVGVTQGEFLALVMRRRVGQIGRRQVVTSLGVAQPPQDGDRTFGASVAGHQADVQWDAVQQLADPGHRRPFLRAHDCAHLPCPVAEHLQRRVPRQRPQPVYPLARQVQRSAAAGDQQVQRRAAPPQFGQQRQVAPASVPGAGGLEVVEDQEPPIAR